MANDTLQVKMRALHGSSVAGHQNKPAPQTRSCVSAEDFVIRFRNNGKVYCTLTNVFFAVLIFFIGLVFSFLQKRFVLFKSKNTAESDYIFLHFYPMTD
jgi:hypothetical protein